MPRGIIYVMTTAVPGLIKIGKTGLDNFESRMYNLERNGYSNVTALRRRFAIEVEDYDEKEKIIGDIFSKSRVQNAELFALDVDLVVQLLSSFDGVQIYPKGKLKEEVFEEATIEREINANIGEIPDGKYFLKSTVVGFGKVQAEAVVEDGIFKILKGAICAPARKGKVTQARKDAPIVNNTLIEDVICTSPSSAGWIVIGRSNNGWIEWKDENGNPIDIYRNVESKE